MSFYINFIHCYMLTYGETADYLMEVNEYILEISGITKEHEPKNESKNAKAANTRSDGEYPKVCVNLQTDVR